MLYRDICRTLAFYLVSLLIPLSVPLCIAIYYDWIGDLKAFSQPASAFAFILTMLVTAVLSAIFWLLGRKSTGYLYRREAIFLVVIIYFMTPAIGGLPFFFSRTLSNPLDCYFEAVSGVTTTGASILFPKKFDPTTEKEIPYTKTIYTGQATTYSYLGTITPMIDTKTHKTLEGFNAVSYSILFWRSFIQWLGGGGIIVLFVAILPALGMGGKVLFQTEITGPSKESMLPRIKETANKLWKIYVVLTVSEVILLMLTNTKIPLFDAIAIAMATISTGGLLPHHDGIAYYNSVYTDIVVMAFMVLGSVNFSIYFYFLRGRFSRLKDPELITFLAILLFACLFATWQLLSSATPLPLATPLNFFQALRYGSFQVISAQSSTGFATANYVLWPFSIQVLLLILMYIGGMAGSTAGGVKVIRLQAFFRILLRKIESIYRPDTVYTYRIGTGVMDTRAATTILCFIMIAIAFVVSGTFFLVLDGVDPETSLATATCMVSNGGMGFLMGGPTESFAFLSSFGKILSCVWMIAGRLEYFALLIAFVPAFWRPCY